MSPCRVLNACTLGRPRPGLRSTTRTAVCRPEVTSRFTDADEEGHLPATISSASALFSPLKKLKGIKPPKRGVRQWVGGGGVIKA